jgi:methylglutaconyl-CoA hydratase
MSSSLILYEKQDYIGRITLNRPEKHNALNRPAMADLVRLVSETKTDPSIRVVVVTGAGEKAFCSGADLNDFPQAGVLEKRDQNEAYRQLCQSFLEVGKPVIGVVNGMALAGGAGLTLLFDLVLASDRSTFGFPEIRAGVFPMMVMGSLFRVVAKRHALDLVMTGRIISAVEALQMGLITRIVPHERLHVEADALASMLAGFSPSALQLGKQAFVSASGMSYEQALQYLKEMSTIVLQTEDASTGVKAFLTKSKPHWKGR